LAGLFSLQRCGQAGSACRPSPQDGIRIAVLHGQDPADAASFRLLRFSFVSIKILVLISIRNTP